VTSQPFQTAFIDNGLLDDFVYGSIRAYEACTPELPPRNWAILLGQFLDDAMLVQAIRYARNVREHDTSVRQEFQRVIVPCFGAAYSNPCRGFWCEPKQLLAATKEARAAGQEVLGSIHLHPDWHRIGPPGERNLKISEAPTPMDHYVFSNTGYPLNMILYLERRNGAIYHSLGAWSPRTDVADLADQPCSPISIRYRSLHIDRESRVVA
jgi:hypothetical protein